VEKDMKENIIMVKEKDKEFIISKMVKRKNIIIKMV
jgi:hypothetical protein